jgi:hypothetical protein
MRQRESSCDRPQSSSTPNPASSVDGGSTPIEQLLHNTNRHDTINGPAITVPPFQTKVADSRPSCRNAVLDAIERLHQRTGASEFARRDIVAEVQTTDASFERQTIYRCLRRLTGQEHGSAHRDLRDAGNGRLRLRA